MFFVVVVVAFVVFVAVSLGVVFVVGVIVDCWRCTVVVLVAVVVAAVVVSVVVLLHVLDISVTFVLGVVLALVVLVGFDAAVVVVLAHAVCHCLLLSYGSFSCVCFFLFFVVSLFFLVVLRLILERSTKEKLPCAYTYNITSVLLCIYMHRLS